MKYALLEYSSFNIGDDIQSIAARRFLPKIDYYIDRDNIQKLGLGYIYFRFQNKTLEFQNFKRIFNERVAKQKAKIILNGWFCQSPHKWPPKNDCIDPLFVSLHLSRWRSLKFFSKKSIEFYKKYEPIGCRDYATLNHLKKRGVDAYFSGCLTLTLQNKFKKRNGIIYFTDIYSKKSFFKKIPSKIRSSIRILSHERENFFKVETKERFRIAQQFIDAYSKAKLVVTSKLHCALPCLALGTPVIFIHPNLKDERFGGLIELMRHHSLDDLNQGKVRINWDNPEPNPVDISPLRKKLVKTCEDFIKKG